MKLLRTLLSLTFLLVLVYIGATVKLGNRTFFGHVSRIWASEETKDLVDGVKETSGPMMRKVERGVKAGIEEASKPDGELDGKPDSKPDSKDDQPAPEPARK